jgi:hypothetical protein
LLLLAGGSVYAADRRSDDPVREAAEWTLYAFMGGAGWYISRQEPRSGTPWLGGATSAPYHDETVPAYMVGLGAGAGGGCNLMLPNEQCWLNETSRRHVRGYCGALAVTGLGVAGSKYLVARRRPSHDNYPEAEKAGMAACHLYPCIVDFRSAQRAICHCICSDIPPEKSPQSILRR